MIPDNTTDIEFVMQTLQGFIMKKFMVRVSHGISGIVRLSPNQWQTGTPPSGGTDYACQHDTLIILQFSPKVKSFWGGLVLSNKADFHPKPTRIGFSVRELDNFLLELADGIMHNIFHECSVHGSGILAIVTKAGNNV